MPLSTDHSRSRGQPLYLRAGAGALVALLLAACQTTSGGSSTTAQTVEVDGANYKVEELTASSWTALPARSANASAQKNAALVKAIEKVSGCKATDSQYNASTGALTAQVSCGDRLKN